MLKFEVVKNTLIEKEILSTIEHPFLLKLDFVFESEYWYYFMMEFVNGGNLYENLGRVKRFPEDTVKFFIS